MMKVFFYTLGCRVNQYETDAVREQFIEAGYEITNDVASADICVVNTCSVTGEADRKSSQQLRKFGRLNPNAIICAMGCASGLREGKIDADIVCGTSDKVHLVEKVSQFIASKATPTHISNHVKPQVTTKDTYKEFGTVLSPEETRAFIKVEDGCDSFCTYCIIPYARGRVVSRNKLDCMKEIEYLASKGFKEIVFTGIHLCSYGKDRGEDIMSLLSLIESASLVEGIERIRMGSLEPMSLTDEFILGLSKIDKYCPHFHLSLQSGSDTVLKRMNRKYTAAQYETIVAKLRAAFPGMSLTTDVICGFPQETEQEFLETKAFVEKLAFSKLHVFPYSVRKGTVAAQMAQLPSGVGKQRTAVLNELSKELEQKYALTKLNQDVSILLEAYYEGDNCEPGYINGYTREYVHSRIYRINGQPVNQEVAGSLKGQVVVAKAHIAKDGALLIDNYSDII